MKADTLRSVLVNYLHLMSLWEEILETRVDAETRGRVLGAKYHMEKYEFLFGK